MSEATTGTPAAGKTSGKKILGIPRTYFIVGVIAVVGGVAFFIYRERKDAAANAASTAGTSETTSGTVGTACTDAYGNPGTLDANGVCETVDESGSISALQTELESLEAAQAGTGTTTTTTGTGTGTTGATGATGAPRPPVSPKPRPPHSWTSAGRKSLARTCTTTRFFSPQAPNQSTMRRQPPPQCACPG